MNFSLGQRMLDEEEQRQMKSGGASTAAASTFSAPAQQRFRPLSTEQVIRATTQAFAEPQGKLAQLGVVMAGGLLFGGAVLGGLYLARKIEEHTSDGKTDEAKPALRWDLATIVPVVLAAVIGAVLVWLYRFVKRQATTLATLAAGLQQPTALPSQSFSTPPQDLDVNAAYAAIEAEAQNA